MRTLRCCAVLLCVAIVLVSLQCSVAPLAGGGTIETTNGIISGIILKEQDIPAKQTRVFLIPTNYNPVMDSAIPDSLIDTTDEMGRYALKAPNKKGRYNIEAVHCVHRTRMLLTDIRLQKDTTYAPIGLLNDPGTVEVILSDSVDTINGFLYCTGTRIFKSLKHAAIHPDGKVVVYLDSIPQTSFSTIDYIEINDPASQVTLETPFIVNPDDTVLVGDTLIWKSYTNQNSGLPDNEIRAITIEADGTIWFATANSGVVSLINTTWAVYDNTNSALLSNSVNDMFQDQTGTLWFATDSGIASFNHGSITVYTSENSNLRSNVITGIDEDSEGTIWCSSFDGGVASFDGTTWTVFWQTIVLPLDDVFDVTLDRNDTVWSATEEGIVKFKDENYVIYDKANSGLISDSVLSVFIDNGRNKWFGQLQGIIRLNKDETAWDYFDHTHSLALSGATNAHCDDIYGTLYIGTSKGLTLYNGRQWRDYTGKRYSFLQNKEITALTFDSQENLWIGTKSKGVIVIGLYEWE